MQKKSGDIFESIQVDPITGKYFVFVPEQIMNEMEWYEDTDIRFSVDGKDLIISEKE